MVYGKLAIRTTTVRGLTASTCLMRSSCSRSSDLRSIASLPSLGMGQRFQPALQVGWLPTTTIATSADLAARTASPLSLLAAKRTSTLDLSAWPIPASGDTVYGGVPLYQSSST